ncbi:MAG: NVEALA domain-containing protein [Tannerellaceae bacterium]|nr:NVEALA domain-containing protein [Tannerellaceae bacterium]
MKKNIVKLSFIALFSIVMGYGVYTTKTNNLVIDLALQNVEALARSESGRRCFTTIGDWGPCVYYGNIGCSPCGY